MDSDSLIRVLPREAHTVCPSVRPSLCITLMNCDHTGLQRDSNFTINMVILPYLRILT